MAMVLTEAVATTSGNCIVISGAGSDDANGLYIPTGKKWHDAEVFENDAKCLLSREPHKNKLGETCYGWILGQDRKPLYAVQDAALTPPTSGWKKFSGAAPLPQFEGPLNYVDGATQAAENFKETGKLFFNASRYTDAEQKWTRALGLAGQRDLALKVALYSNRSEARLRLFKYDAALSDAQDALRLKPTHDKALLRAAVAARELKMYQESYDFVQKCIEINPRHMEAKVLLSDLEYLIQDIQSSQPDMAKVARKKLEDSIKLQDEELRGKKLGAKDVNLLAGVKAFQGYGDKREKAAAEKDERPPLSKLPYHQQGLGELEVKAMDKLFQEQRDKKDFEKIKAKKEKDNYAKIKEQFKARVEEDVREGRMSGLEEIFKSEQQWFHGQGNGQQFVGAVGKEESLAVANAKAKTEPTETVTLSPEEMAEIDGLFAGLPTKDSQPLVPAVGASSKKKKLEQARLAVMATPA